ncbi:metalloregulator ArsR/SmtB family transcription factor [Bacillus timonensis]|nr:metalloregulator ArsR/SmtB family transcription factor [Bacillus timonensis]
MTYKVCNYIFNHMVKYDDAHLDEVFSVLSDPTRRQIIERLATGEMTVSQLAEPFDMSLPAVSKHLKVLEKAGLVSQRKEGRFRFYFLTPKSIDCACEWLSGMKRFWSNQFSKIEHYICQTKKE